MTPEQQKQIEDRRSQIDKLNQSPAVKKFAFILLGIVVLFIVVVSLAEPDRKTEAKAEVKPEASAAPAVNTHQQQVDAMFSKWDGSQTNLVAAIKEHMNDPSSYEHVKTVYWDFQDSVIIKTTIRGNNAFGSKVLQTFRAVADIDGTLRHVEQQ